jgi:hypothetical protein
MMPVHLFHVLSVLTVSSPHNHAHHVFDGSSLLYGLALVTTYVQLIIYSRSHWTLLTNQVISTVPIGTYSTIRPLTHVYHIS